MAIHEGKVRRVRIESKDAYGPNVKITDVDTGEEFQNVQSVDLCLSARDVNLATLHLLVVVDSIDLQAYAEEQVEQVVMLGGTPKADD